MTNPLQPAIDYFNGDELAANVWYTKYALRDASGNVLETTPADTHRRLAREFARIEANYPNPMSEEEIYDLLADWTVVPQGSPMSAIGNTTQIQSTSNCFVVENPTDSYGGILLSDQELAQIMKRRGGVGVDISTIRPKGMRTSNAAGTTDGIGVFMDRYSSTCREVAQGGRRGALMISVSCVHPDVETFINIKRDKTRVTGANVSVRMTDEFLRAVEADTEVALRWPVDSTVETAKFTKVVRAKDIWDQLVQANWESAEPGILFWDTVTSTSMADLFADRGFTTISTNPCLVGSTRIRLVSGQHKTLKELAESGEDVLVHTVNTLTGKIEQKLARNPRLTAKDADTLEVTFMGGDSIVGTPDHPVMSNDMQRVTLEDLYPGDIMYGGAVVRSVEPAGKQDVYNVTVEGNHNYFIVASNGKSLVNTFNCGEIPLSAYDSCRLLLLNLAKFITDPFTDDAAFDYDRFEEVTKKAQRLMDDMVDLEIEAVDRIIEKVRRDPEPDNVKAVELDLWLKIREAATKGRRTGLGITGLGDAIAMLGVKYGSQESVEVTDDIYRTLETAAHESSTDMAVERGSFPACEPSVYRHAIDQDHPMVSRLANYDDRFLSCGRRNIALTTTAPAGSMSIMTQTASGCEPVFMLSYTRRKKVNPSDPNARVDFIDDLGDKWTEFTVYHHGVKKWMDVTGETDITKSPYWGATANEIDWNKSVEIQAAAQQWVEHAISKTTNLPADVTREKVSELYLQAWKSGCKGMTIYRDGSRSGVLVSKSAEKKPSIVATRAPKRPESLPCDIHRTQIGGEPYVMLIGLMEGAPYEVFCGLSSHIGLPKSKITGAIVKNPRKKGPATYDLVIPSADGGDITIGDIVTVFDNPTHGAFTRTLSLSLRHGVPVQFVVEQLRKDKYSDMSSFACAVARVLSKHYVADGTKVHGEKQCPECGSDNVSYQNGCATCMDCGSSKCS